MTSLQKIENEIHQKVINTPLITLIREDKDLVSLKFLHYILVLFKHINYIIAPLSPFITIFLFMSGIIQKNAFYVIMSLGCAIATSYSIKDFIHSVMRDFKKED